MTSEAKLKANAKHIKSLDSITIRVKKGNKDLIKHIAKIKGYSLNGYINKLISDDMKEE